jgi:hypothetical protein
MDLVEGIKALSELGPDILTVQPRADSRLGRTVSPAAHVQGGRRLLEAPEKVAALELSVSQDPVRRTPTARGHERRISEGLVCSSSSNSGALALLTPRGAQSSRSRTGATWPCWKMCGAAALRALRCAALTRMDGAAAAGVLQIMVRFGYSKDQIELLKDTNVRCAPLAVTAVAAPVAAQNQGQDLPARSAPVAHGSRCATPHARHLACPKPHGPHASNARPVCMWAQ